MTRFLSALKAPLRLFRQNRPTVTVLELHGAIGVDARAGRGLSATSVESSLKKAFKNKRDKAVVLAVNSPGGAPAQSRMIMERARHLARQKQMTLLTYIEDVGASGGYMIALAGEDIMADPFAIVGSIGVVSASFGFSEAIERIGVERRVHTAGENKVRLDPFRPEREEDREKLEAILDQTHELFIDIVKRRRGDRLTAPDNQIFNGDFFLAEEGRKLGLIDEIGDLRTLMQQRFGHDVRLRSFNAHRTGLIGLLSYTMMGALIDAAASRIRLEGLMARLGR
jgi:signal peptide peptidase SppA